MQSLAFRSDFHSPDAKNEMRAKNEREAQTAKFCIPAVTVRVFQSSFENEIVISIQNRLFVFLLNGFLRFYNQVFNELNSILFLQFPFPIQNSKA